MARQKLSIAFFHLGFVYSGGGERLVLQEMGGLKKRGHRVTCFTPLLDKDNCFPDIIKRYDVRTILPQWLLSLLPRQSLKLILSAFWLPLKVFELRKFDIFVGANQPGPFFCWMIHLMLGKPYVVYLAQPTRIVYSRKVDREAGMIFKDRFLLLPFLVKAFSPLIIWLDRISIQKSRKMLVNGDYILNVLEQIYGSEGVNCPAGSFLKPRPGVNKWIGSLMVSGQRITKPYIFLSNRHFPQKKFEWGLKAFARLTKKTRASTQLVISGGETFYTQELKKEVENLGLTGNTVFTGLVGEKDLEKLYCHAAVYIYPAPEEDFGMGIIEAMAAGTAVVAWRAGGPIYTVIDGETGFLIDPYDIGKFSRTTKLLLDDQRKNRVLSRKASNHARSNFTVKKHLDILENAINQSLDEM